MNDPLDLKELHSDIDGIIDLYADEMGANITMRNRNSMSKDIMKCIEERLPSFEYVKKYVKVNRD